MSLTRWKAVAVVLLAACTVAILAFMRSQAGRSGRFATDEKLICVIISSENLNLDREQLVRFVTANVMPLARRIAGTGGAASLGGRIPGTRIRPNLDRLRAHDLTPEDIMKAVVPSSMIGAEERLSGPAVELPLSNGQVLTYFGLRMTPEQLGNTILKANPDGDILRLKEVCEMDPIPQPFEVCPEIDGRPAATITLKPPAGRGVAVVAAIREELARVKEELFPPGMDFEIIAPEDRGMICAVIKTSQDRPLEYTTAVGRELAAIARGIDEVASVAALTGYNIRTEGPSPHAVTCFIRLKDRSDRKRTPRQVIAQLEEQCRTRQITPDCFEPAALREKQESAAIGR